jgi:hypothetical protein
MDSTSSCDLLCFLDAYSGFHQISISREDEEHTTFITVDGLYCYTSMPYGLQNALPTFVRAMHKTFGDLIVKIKLCISSLDNLALVFDRLRSTRTKLNLDKCVFGVSAGKLHGIMISHRGIEANPEKIKEIEVMHPPLRTYQRCSKAHEMTDYTQSVYLQIGRTCSSILQVLRKFEPFVWTQKADETFQELKRYLTSLPVMVALEPGDPVLLYIVATAEVVSMVLVME